MGFGIEGLKLRVWSSGLGGLGLRVWGLGLKPSNPYTP